MAAIVTLAAIAVVVTTRPAHTAKTPRAMTTSRQILRQRVRTRPTTLRRRTWLLHRELSLTISGCSVTAPERIPTPGSCSVPDLAGTPPHAPVASHAMAATPDSGVATAATVSMAETAGREAYSATVVTAVTGSMAVTAATAAAAG